MSDRYILLILLAAQTLGEAGRREAERRKAVDEQGVEVKVIERASTSANAPPAPKTRVPGLAAAAKGNERFRASFQKADREMRQVQDRLELVRRRLEREKSNARHSRLRNAAAAEEKLEREMDLLELRLKRLQSERLDAYNAARKAGLLPGEIDGKGITP